MAHLRSKSIKLWTFEPVSPNPYLRLYRADRIVVISAEPNGLQNRPDIRDMGVWFRAATLEGYRLVLQRWVWDGVGGQSLIFLSPEVEKLSDAELEALARKAPFVTGEITLTRGSSGFDFVNFGFEVWD